jgi:hypothetical protein
MGVAQPDGAGGPPPDGQGGPPSNAPKPPSVEDQVKSLDKLLKFSDEQKTKVTAVLKQSREDEQKVFENESTSFADKRIALKDIHETANSKVRELLSDDQKKKFDEYVKKHQHKNSEGGPGDGEGGPDGPPPDGPPPGDGGGPGGGGPGGGF